MSRVHYYLICLGAALFIAAIASAVIVQRLRARERRQLGAIELLRALDRYGVWFAAQCRGTFFQSMVQDADTVLQDISALQDRYFPVVWREVQDLFAVHAKLTQCLRHQQVLRLRDPERWIESSHDDALLTLWLEHRRAARAMEQRLAPVARSPAATGRTVSPA